ncbi:MAG: flagellar motor switch protein FliM [Defluviitaleaceae bacterium]|nr:flagellar motor switch protein FliM [Defluviitaleaceae bacterium]
MSDILSQAEIDALLKALNSGDEEALKVKEEPAKEARNYNFARPSKFNKEQLRTLEIIYENYARLLTSFFTGYMRTHCVVEVANAEQMTYNEFNNSLVNPVVLGIIDFSPLKGSIVLEMSSNLGYAIIERILGGIGLGIKVVRDFSEIEKILLSRILSNMIARLPEPWENVLQLKPRLDKIETNSQFAQIFGPNEMIALVTLRVKVGSTEGMINFCLPHLVISPIMDRLYTKFWFEQIVQTGGEDIYREELENQINKAVVPLIAVVGKSTITVNEFVNLQVGDIIPLDSYITSDMNIYVGDLLKFYARPGIKRGKNAFQITSHISKEEE